MSKKRNKRVSNRTKSIQNPSYILKVKAYTPIAKPLNGSLPRSNQAHFLKLFPIKYQYKNGKEKKETDVLTYFIKGLRGCIRHAVMHVCNTNNLDVCHTTDKEFDSSGNSLLPPGFHLLGGCITGTQKEECLVHSIFGSKGHEGKIRAFAYPIASISHKSFESSFNVQNVHIATENRVCLTFDNRSAQDFGERYFSGEFTFEIDVTRLNDVQRGLIIEALMNLERIGRGYNSGYGLVKIKEFQLLKRCITRTPQWQGDKFSVKEEITEESLKKEVLNAMEAWQQYLN